MAKLLHRDVLAKLIRGRADGPQVWQTPAVAPPSRIVRILALCLAEWLFLVPPALANPQGGVVHGGSAVITGQGTPVVTVHQFSNNAVLSWQTFNIQRGEKTNFQQPSANAVAINRILDGQASTILGSLNATGHVYLINPNGILFGKGSSVNVYALAAATSAKAGQLAAQSRDGFDPSAVSAPGAKIVNQGQISAGSGGFVYLVAPEVKNGEDGVIVAPGGEIQLAAGATVYLTDRADGTGLAVAYTAPGSPGGSAVNLGKLVSDAGFVQMRAAIVRQNGLVEANSVREKNGRIELVADQSLQLASGSVTEARGGNEGASPGGPIEVSSGGDAAVQTGAVVDASGGRQGGAGGSIEVSAKNKVDLSGTFRVAGSHGAKGGTIRVDPAQVEIGTETIDGGSGSVSVEASQTITLDPGATVSLIDPIGSPTYALYSGGDIVFGMGSQITDASAPGTAANHWNVQLVAGAVDQDVGLAGNQVVSSPTLNGDTKPNPAGTTAGGIYLSGGSGTTGALQPLSNNGLVSLGAGTLTALASGDIWIGNGGGFKDQTGNIDVEAGRNVSFAAGQGQDSVIENGSGSIRVVASGSVLLNAHGNGNAAIRTRGIQDPNNPNQATRTDGGSIVVWAQTGNVDAGNANRWLQPGAAEPGCTDAAGCNDIMPVVANGILGIGSEAGGNVTVVAGGNVTTGNSLLPRTGGSAGNPNGIGDYTGGHIGVFGQPVVLVPRTTTQSNTLLALPNSYAANLLVVAGGTITGDYMERAGAAVFRAGYALAPNGDPGTLSAAQVALNAPGSAASPLVVSAAAAADPTQGWVGTLARPITFDLLFGRPLANGATIDVLGANGVAVRTIESPSLVYPPISTLGLPNLQVPGYSPDDAAYLEAETGDVALLGNNIGIVPDNGNGPVNNPNVRILPPTLQVTTHTFQRGLESRGGDFVMLDDFVMFPSASGGLTLNVAGQVRTANYAVTGNASFSVNAETLGPADLQAFTIPSGTLLVDPQTGLEFTLIGPINFQPRIAATPAQGFLLFRATPQAANGAVLIPKGTRVTDQAGQVYVVTAASEIPPPNGRASQGAVSFFAVPGGPATVTVIPKGTILATPDGVQFATTADVTLQPGQREAVGSVVALQPGVDAAPGTLHLLIPPSIAGIAFATNRAPTVRLPEAEIAVQSVGVGAQTNQPTSKTITFLLDPLPGIEAVSNDQGVGGGTDAATFGVDPNADSSALAQLSGPIATLAAGHTLVLKDPSILPKGVPPQDVQITLSASSSTESFAPAVFKTLQVERNKAGVITSSRIDPPSNEFAFPTGDQVWFRDPGNGTSAGLQQSDADPSYDTRAPRDTPALSYKNYYASCHSGATLASCGATGLKLPQVLGTGPTHAGDPTPASLFADAGFSRIELQLAQPAMLSTNGNVFDLALRTEQTSSSEQTVISVPTGNASFGTGVQTLLDTQQIDPKTHLPLVVPVPVPTDAQSGLEVSGPGSAEILVGVVPFAKADKDHDGLIRQNEFPGSSAVFASLEQPDALGNLVPELTAQDAPFIPTGTGGVLTLASSASSGFLLGIQTIGNLPSLPLPAGGANLTVVAAENIQLEDRGFIGTLQGGALTVSSVGGSILGGFPATGVGEKRGIVTLYSDPGIEQHPANATGGGPISVNSFGDFDIGGLALAALSGSNITIDSRAGSVKAGLGSPFSSPTVLFSENVGGLTVQYAGSGVFANTGAIDIVAKQTVDIGAGISGGVINITAQSVLAGSGSINSTSSVTFNVTGTISGNIQAVGSINVASGTLSSAASASSTGGLVTGAGAASVASNTGSGRASAEQNLASQSYDRSTFTGGLGNSSGNGASGKRVVLIDVSSQPCSPQDKDCSS